MPWKTFKDGNRYCVHKLNDDGSMGDQVACHASMAEADDQVAALYANVAELARQSPKSPGSGLPIPPGSGLPEPVFDVLLSEFKGTPPDIPTRPGVDMEALTDGDPDPFFISLEISTIGRVSKNGLLHDDALASTLVEQINAGSGAEGIMGHIKQADRGSAYPVSDVHWVGATRMGDSVWAKGYIPKTAQAQREHFRILKAVNGRAATSIAGPAIRETIDQTRGVWRAKDFRLEQLDLAPYSRAALKPETPFVITAEMAPGQASDEQEVAEMERIQELEAMVAETKTRVSELEAENASLKAAHRAAQVREFDRALDDKVAALVDWQVKGDAAQAKVDAFRRNLRARLVAEMGDDKSVDRLMQVSETVWAEFLPLAETLRDALAGPAALAPAKAPRQRIEDTPENRAKARAQFQF